MNNGYTQITIGEKPVGIKFAYEALKLFIKASENKVDIYFDGQTLTILGMAKLIQSGYIINCELKEAEPEIKFDNFYEWVEQNNETPDGLIELNRVIKVYSDSVVNKKLIEKSNDNEKKSQQMTA